MRSHRVYALHRNLNRFFDLELLLEFRDNPLVAAGHFRFQMSPHADGDFVAQAVEVSHAPRNGRAPAHHPVVDAYRAYQAMPYDAPTGDLAMALYAAHPDSPAPNHLLHDSPSAQRRR